jgi:hypothetical protein
MAKNHPDQHIITRCVGMGAALQIEFNRTDVRVNDVFILCSDGLYKYVDDRELMEIATGLTAQEAAERMVELANERGGDDNTTVLVLKVRSIPEGMEVDDDEGELATSVSSETAMRIERRTPTPRPRPTPDDDDFNVDADGDDGGEYVARGGVATASDTRAIAIAALGGSGEPSPGGVARSAAPACFGAAGRMEPEPGSPGAGQRAGRTPPSPTPVIPASGPSGVPDPARARSAAPPSDAGGSTVHRALRSLWFWIIFLEVVLIAVFEALS